MIPAYPLQWPAGWPRTDIRGQRHGKFCTVKREPGRAYNSHADITIAEATKRVLTELGRMGIDRESVVISTNLALRLDGLPRSGQPAPVDAGAAVYWQTRKGERRVMAIDQYYKVEENLAAIAATLDAMRAIERHGGAQILDRAFTGFAALPAPSTGKPWRAVFGFAPDAEVTLDELAKRCRTLWSRHHPDKPGGSHAIMADINAARDQAEKEIRSCGS